MGYHARIGGTAVTLIRPRLLIQTARIGARLYQRKRDLAAALPGHASGPDDRLVDRLADAEQDCEDLRQLRSPAYRPASHVQVLAALLAESGQAKASGSDSLRLAMYSRRPSSMPASSSGAT